MQILHNDIQRRTTSTSRTRTHAQPPTISFESRWITMHSGKTFYLYKGFTYCFKSKTKNNMRYRCSQGCKAFIVLTNEVLFAQSQRGGQLLVFQGYSYSLLKIKNEIGHWRCSMGQPGTPKRCTAKLYTNANYKVLDMGGTHTHKKPRFVKRNDMLVRTY
ncbi:uncharacterized protein LOC132902133 [Amyelois transitella]|uniref:uncharacterized protein LOC132902133 n=1 Tax=Amyelois transitella TaxID=680683 RepID=UPI00298FB3E8|nr:uncharacterized protein LOC132902133 [Amyelois transitella]